MFCEDTISGYEVRFYDPNFSQSNVTRYVGANRTFYGVTEEDRLAGENTHVQVIKIIMPHLMHNDITLGYFFLIYKLHSHVHNIGSSPIQ